MGLNIAHIFMTGMCFRKIKMRKFLLIMAALALISSCRMPTNFGFYQPILFDLKVPDGTPEFKAGWYDGCKSGIANANFLNSAVYLTKAGPSFSPIYTNNSDYRSAWGNAFWACLGYDYQFAGELNSMKHAPLE